MKIIMNACILLFLVGLVGCTTTSNRECQKCGRASESMEKSEIDAVLVAHARHDWSKVKPEFRVAISIPLSEVPRFGKWLERRHVRVVNPSVVVEDDNGIYVDSTTGERIPILTVISKGRSEEDVKQRKWLVRYGIGTSNARFFSYRVRNRFGVPSAEFIRPLPAFER